MSEREVLKDRIENCLRDSTCVRTDTEESYCTAAEQILRTIDLWIEEQGDSEEIKVGDKVRLKRGLRQSDGSQTQLVCDVSDEMEEIPAGDTGEVEYFVNTGDEVLHVKFESVDDSWCFHVDDLEKVQP